MVKEVVSSSKDVRAMLASLRDFATARRDIAQSEEERHRKNPVLDVQRQLTPAEDAVYWAAFHSGQADAYRVMLDDLARYQAGEETS